MWQAADYHPLKGKDYWDALNRDLGNLLSFDEPAITTLSNAAAFIFNVLEDINWAGFYLFDDKKLILGPFGGKPACTTIALGSGVCGTAAHEKRTVIVPDVEAFPGHIACDGDSRSEIVIPLIDKSGNLIGVLDIDSPNLNRFSNDDGAGLESLAAVVISKLRLPINDW
ncbi:MAG TPA: GAF domain-containing protein [Candidatus Kapabacteria bacterium]